MSFETSKARAHLFAVAFAGVLALLGLVLTEAALRLFYFKQLGRNPEVAVESLAWHRDERFGWNVVPNTSVVYSNGFFRGEVNTDSSGIRRNARDGTRLPDARTIFLIGNSTAAAMEVDDHETVPARLEARLRSRGARVNILNLGVRGYGTDQSVLRALSLAEEHRPSEIIYLFTNNDFFDSNVLREASRKYGKGVFLRRRGETTFSPFRFPVPEYDAGAVGVIVLDDDCHPVVHEDTWAPSPQQPGRRSRLRNALAKNVLLYRGFELARERWSPDRSVDSTIEPHRMIYEEGITWDERFSVAYYDRGATFTRCPEYFEGQMASLLTLLRQIDGLERISVVLFPDGDRIADAELLAKSQTRRLFENLEQAAVIDDLLDLSVRMVEQGHDYEDFDCPHDPHFCEEGNDWIAQEIERAFYSDGPGMTPLAPAETSR